MPTLRSFVFRAVRFCSRFTSLLIRHTCNTLTCARTHTHVRTHVRRPGLSLSHRHARLSFAISAMTCISIALRREQPNTEDGKKPTTKHNSPKTNKHKIHTGTDVRELARHGMLSITPFMYKMSETMTHPFSLTLLAVLITQQQQSNKHRLEKLLHFFCFVHHNSTRFAPSKTHNQRF